MLNYKKETLLLMAVWLVRIVAHPHTNCCSNHHRRCPFTPQELHSFGLNGCTQVERIGGFSRGQMLSTEDSCPGRRVCVRFSRHNDHYVLTTTHTSNVSECKIRIKEDCDVANNCTIYWRTVKHVSADCKFGVFGEMPRFGPLNKRFETTYGQGNKCNSSIDFYRNNLFKINPCINSSQSEIAEFMGRFRCLESIRDGEYEMMFLIERGNQDRATMRYNSKKQQLHLVNEINYDLDNDCNNCYDPYYMSQYDRHQVDIFEPGKVFEYQFLKVNEPKEIKLIKPEVRMFPLFPSIVFSTTPPETTPPKTTPPTTTPPTTTPPTTTPPTTTPPTTTIPTTTRAATIKTPSFIFLNDTCNVFQIHTPGSNVCVTAWHKLISTIIIVFLILLLIFLVLFLLLIFCRRERKSEQCKPACNDNQQQFRCLVSHVN